MSMLNRPGNGNDIGEVIASTKDYEAAQKIVSKLIAGEVPARDIAIVGEGVRTVERVTGKLGYAAAARSGAMNGVLIGLLLSAIMLFGTPDAPISLFLGFILIGVALGMIMSLVMYSIVRRRRDFASMMQMLADHYEVRVQPSSLTKARGIVGPDRPSTVRPPVDLSEPPRYGERLQPGGGTPSGGTSGGVSGGGVAGGGVSGGGVPGDGVSDGGVSGGGAVGGDIGAGEVGGVEGGGPSGAGGGDRDGNASRGLDARAGERPVGGHPVGDAAPAIPPRPPLPATRPVLPGEGDASGPVADR
ncbi:general stress protein [Microbacterium sp. USHLN186]|uniref:general stress protein n=1 Tax=Microbacterium sp. USHLN186 TaxID=3081286 RepID=UPI00301B6779